MTSIQKQNRISEIRGLIDEKMEMMKNASSNSMEDRLNDQILELEEELRELESE